MLRSHPRRLLAARQQGDLRLPLRGSVGPGWSAALCGYTLAPEASLTQITNELKSAFDWLDAKAGEHGIQGPIIVTGWSAGGHLTSFILDHPRWRRGWRSRACSI
jgi:Esterase/lipase